jgi:hypothetical protein
MGDFEDYESASSSDLEIMDASAKAMPDKEPNNNLENFHITVDNKHFVSIIELSQSISCLLDVTLIREFLSFREREDRIRVYAEG